MNFPTGATNRIKPFLSLAAFFVVVALLASLLLATAYVLVAG